VWAWHGGRGQSYWSTSTRTFTGVVQRGVFSWRRIPPRGDHPGDWQYGGTHAPGAQAPEAEARYGVAIAGPWRRLPDGTEGHVERYVLVGSLIQVQAKLAAALERRQRAYDTREQEVVTDAA
jgi:hypothetical protein